MRHAKHVVASDDELFITLGFRNQLFGAPHARWDVPLFEGAGCAAVMAIGYYIIGKIQESNLLTFTITQLLLRVSRGISCLIRNSSMIILQGMKLNKTKVLCFFS